MKLSESSILVLTTIISGIAALFSLIGLTTPKWLRTGYGLWNCNGVCSTATATLTILALFLLVITVVLLVIQFIHLFPRKFRILPLILMIIATFFLLISTSIYLRHSNIIGYSFELIVTAHAFAFIASVILAFWFGTTLNENNAITITKSSLPLTTVVLPTSRSVS